MDELIAYVDLCFHVMGEYDMKEVSNRTGLSLATIYRLRTGEYTLAMQVNTLEVLGAAAGLKLEMNPYGFKVVVVA